MRRGGPRAARAMTQFDLTEDQLQIQEMAARFTADAITPFAAEWDEKHIFPKDTIREAALIFEAMAYGCPSTSAFISIHNMVAWMIDRFGSPELKEKHLPSLIPME